MTKTIFDEFKNKDIVGLGINFVFYTDLKFVDAEYNDSILPTATTYSLYETQLKKNGDFSFWLASRNRYKSKG